MSTPNEHLARLLGQQLSELGSDTQLNSDVKLGKFFGVDWKTVFNWRNGHTAPTPNKRSSIESKLHWKQGSINRLLTGEGAFLSLDDVRDLPAEERPVKRASDLTDDELAMEMMRRFRNYADVAHKETSQPGPDMFDLAANHPSTPKRFRTPKN